MHRGDRAGGRTGQARPRILLEGIRKSFVPGRPVLRGVDLAVAPSEIHALLEEGADFLIHQA
ncbi:MAG TPA: hypothetical protein ENO23_10650, partial [Alphaproteobacteria bacterium]|nr:hypothetical protein [Alphaproteobacteria bacterium]